MLGDKIHELQARITSVRVLPAEAGSTPKVEISYQGKGKILGVEVTEMGTYCSITQADGTMFGEGNGILMTKRGETISWRGQGRGRSTGKGLGANWRGAIYYTATSSKLARLNGVPAIFEWETDEEGNGRGSMWEWK